MKDSVWGASLLLGKGMKRFLLMMLIMVLGLVVAWRGVSLSQTLLCCPDMKNSHFYNGFIPSSARIEERKNNEERTQSSKMLVAQADESLVATVEERNYTEQLTIQSNEKFGDGGHGLAKETNEQVMTSSQSGEKKTGDEGEGATIAMTKENKINDHTTTQSSEKIAAKRGRTDKRRRKKKTTVQSANKLVTRGDDLISGCDYSSGKWVKDKERPLYSGKKCKAWLSGMWACRLMDRPDFDFEHYRWQPDTCNLPKFDGHTFLSRMQHKVLAFVGDSIGRQQYQSMMCLITGGEDDLVVEDVSLKFGFVKPHGALRADGTAQRFKLTNTTIVFHWSSSLCEIGPLNRENHELEYALHLDRPATFLQKYINKLDVLLLNTGHHWNRGKFNANKWVMHVDGSPNKDHALSNFKAAHNFSVHKVVSWLHQQLEKNNTKASIYMRSLSPRHFFNGEWDSGGTCDSGNIPVEQKNITGRITRDLVAESAVLGTRVKLLNVTYLSQFRDEAHISRYRFRQGGGQDCLHWCLPGVPDVWNEILYADLFFQNGSKRISNREGSVATL